MEHTLSTATWFWLVVPMSTIVVLSWLGFLVSLFKGDRPS